MRARRERGVGSPIGSILGKAQHGVGPVGQDQPSAFAVHHRRAPAKYARNGPRKQKVIAHRSPNASQASASPSACQAWDETP